MHIHLHICMYLCVFDTKEANLEKEKGMIGGVGKGGYY